jgi:hypothetical protein
MACAFGAGTLRDARSRDFEDFEPSGEYSGIGRR